MDRAMPEAHVLYTVAAVVFAGLVAWTVLVLAKAKEPWGRPPPPLLEPPPAAEAPLVAVGMAAARPEPEPEGDADATAQATPVTIADAQKTVEEPPK
jgi:hypothetical protein